MLNFQGAVILTIFTENTCKTSKFHTYQNYIDIGVMYPTVDKKIQLMKATYQLFLVPVLQSYLNAGWATCVCGVAQTSICVLTRNSYAASLKLGRTMLWPTIVILLFVNNHSPWLNKLCHPFTYIVSHVQYYSSRFELDLVFNSITLLANCIRNGSYYIRKFTASCLQWSS